MVLAYGYDMSVEVWKEIPDFPDYEVSTFGRLRRIRPANSNRAKVGLLKANTCRTYHRFGLYNGGKIRTLLVHRIILMTFVGPPPSQRHQGAHEDDTPSNNRLDNLRWATPKENSEDRVIRGRQVSGTSHPNTRLTDKQIKAIRALNSRGVGVLLIADAVGIGATSVGRIVRGETYR